MRIDRFLGPSIRRFLNRPLLSRLVLGSLCNDSCQGGPRSNFGVLPVDFLSSNLLLSLLLTSDSTGLSSALVAQICTEFPEHVICQGDSRCFWWCYL